MNRLLKIGFDTFLTSLFPVISWFLLGLLVDKSLLSVFALTYPIQFLVGCFRSIFATGTNISGEKNQNKDIILSGMTVGMIAGFIVFGLLILNIDSYIQFMNMDVTTYHYFAIYSIALMYLQFVLSLVVHKLYYENNNSQANKYTLTFNIINIGVLLFTAIFLKQQILIVTITLLFTFLFIIYVVIKTYKKFIFTFNILRVIKYDSIELFNNLIYIVIFLFGISNVIQYGEEYAIVFTFIALITDTQWDIFESIATVAKIDVSKNQFHYKEHVVNAYKLAFLLLGTILFLFIFLYRFYDVNFFLCMIFLGGEILNLLLYPTFRIKSCYIQIEHSAFKATLNRSVADILRMLCSFLKTPYCIVIGQALAAVYQAITVNVFWRKK